MVVLDRPGTAADLGETVDPARAALIDDAGVISHGELADLVAQASARLPPRTTERLLVHVPLVAERAVVIGYLAVLLAGHVALVTPEDNHATITGPYQPDVRLLRDGTFIRTGAPAGAHDLHPDLALLLSTSGSTGSPRLVRLSRSNLVSNADAIVDALKITAADRAITSLPLFYCFGLSVLHAQLRAGGSVVLRHRSVTDPDFPDQVARHKVTLLAATPHLIDVFDVQGLLDRELSHLRLIAQAGGALPPDRVREVAARGRAHGWGLALMYGQTEATARMTVLPPELAAEFPDAVGWPVRGSTFRLDTEVPGAQAGPRAVGELVFAGPGVMLGYAEHPDDLALGRMHTELRTGDLGTIDSSGLVRVVGRRSDFVKILGIRIDLGQVQRILRAHEVTACVTGTADQLQVTYRQAAVSADTVRRIAEMASGLVPSVISVRSVKTLPMLSNGKVDRNRCADGHSSPTRTAAPRTTLTPTISEQAGGRAVGLVDVVAVLGPFLSRNGLDPDRSFVELGGDSFNHAQASVRLSELLGELPTNWHHRPLRTLPALARPRRGSRSFLQPIEMSVLLRAAAVVMICGSHVGLFPLAGGAHILVAVAGVMFGRYVLSASSGAERWRRTSRAFIGIAVPSVAVAAAMVGLFGEAHWSNVTLLHWLFEHGRGNIFWFVEALLFLIVATTAVLNIPPIRAAYAAHPWAVAMVGLLVLSVPRYVVLAVADGAVRGMPGTVAWLFAAGVAMSQADTWPRRVITAASAMIVTIGFFHDPVRNLVIAVGLVLLAVVATVPLPKVLVRPTEVLAAASLQVYLIQFQMFAFFDSPVLEFAAGLAAGVVFWALTVGVLRRLQQLIPLTPAVVDPPERTAHASTHLLDRPGSHRRLRPARLPVESGQRLRARSPGAAGLLLAAPEPDQGLGRSLHRQDRHQGAGSSGAGLVDGPSDRRRGSVLTRRPLPYREQSRDDAGGARRPAR